MMERNFEQFNNNDNRATPSRIEEKEPRIHLTVAEIEKQLAISADKYNDALEKLKAGNTTDKEYLVLYQANLLDWMDDIKKTEGALTRKDAEVLEEVGNRIYLISEEIDRT